MGISGRASLARIVLALCLLTACAGRSEQEAVRTDPAPTSGATLPAQSRSERLPGEHLLGYQCTAQGVEVGAIDVKDAHYRSVGSYGRANSAMSLCSGFLPALQARARWLLTRDLRRLAIQRTTPDQRSVVGIAQLGGQVDIISPTKQSDFSKPVNDSNPVFTDADHLFFIRTATGVSSGKQGVLYQLSTRRETAGPKVGWYHGNRSCRSRPCKPRSKLTPRCRW